MNVEDLLYRRFIFPMEKHKRVSKKIGVEFEFPLVSFTPMTNKMVIEYLFGEMIQDGFLPVFNRKQEMIGVEKELVVRVSLDTSYNNLEFAFAPMNSIGEIEKIWRELIEKMRAILYGHALIIDAGIHPLFGSLDANFLNDDESVAEKNFLAAYSTHDFHGQADFFAFISSVQTHLEFSFAALPQAINVLSKLDFAEIMLFANSPLRTKEGWFRSARHYFYTRCVFKSIGLSGSIDNNFSSIEEVVHHYAQRSIFFRWREHCEFFAPVPLVEYFRNPKYQAKEIDLNCFYSYRNLELKRYGTLERRVACTQPFAQSFAPVAFSVGIAERINEAEVLVEKFLYDQKIFAKNQERCELAARGVLLGDSESLYQFLGALWQLAIDGLQERALGEEKYLDCFDENYAKIIGWNKDEVTRFEKAQ